MKECLKGTDKSESLIAGFKKVGKAPFNPQQALARLPNPTKPTDDPTDNVDSSGTGSGLVSDTILQFLNEKKFPSTPNTKKKRKKVCVTPGKSVSAEDFIDEPLAVPSTSKDSLAVPSTSKDETGTSNQKQKKKPKKKKLDESASSSNEEDSDDYSIYSEFEYEDFDDNRDIET